MQLPLASLQRDALVALAAALAFSPRALPAQSPTSLPRVTADVRALAGCYRLTTRWLDAPRGYPGAVPLPSVLHLDTLPQRYTGRSPDFRAGAAITFSHELPSESGWRPYGRDSLTVSWWDGYTGPTLVLRRAEGEWLGTATYAYHEDRAPGPRMAVAAGKAPCR